MRLNRLDPQTMRHPILIQTIISLSVALLLHQPLQAQIASPSNAGGNAGNNSSGSTITPISTPTFTPIVQIPTVEGVSVTTSGGITTVMAIPAIVTAVTSAVASSTPTNSLLAAVVNGPASSLALLTTASPIDITLTPENGASQQPTSITQLQQEVATIIGQGNALSVSSLTVASEGSITPTADGISISIAGQEVPITSSGERRVAISQFAAIAILSKLSPDSLSIGASIVASGADPVQAARLMVGLQGLANATELTSLSTGIDAFNRIVTTTSDTDITILARQQEFLVARNILTAARSTISG